MRTLTLLSLAVSCFGCALDVAEPPSDTDAPYDDEPAQQVETAQSELRIGRASGGGLGSSLGWTPPSCSSCYDQLVDCMRDAGGDSDLIELCRWESDVCHKHCEGPIIAIH